MQAKTGKKIILRNTLYFNIAQPGSQLCPGIKRTILLDRSVSQIRGHVGGGEGTMDSDPSGLRSWVYSWMTV